MDNADDKIERSLVVLRQKYLEHLGAQIQNIRDFAVTCRQGKMKPEMKEPITCTAHKLAGSGATYGFPKITGAARGLEDALLAMTPVSDEMLGNLAQALADACAEARGETSSPPPAAPREIMEEDRRFTIVSVDDDENMRELLKKIFEMDADVFQASDGKEALAVIRDRMPDVIILDLNMPNLDGMGFLRLLDQMGLKKQTAVIVLTANKQSGGVIEAIKLGVLDYVVKPFAPRAFRKRVLDLLTHLNQKILIADDDEDICNLLSNKFRALGYNVFVARDGDTVFSIAETEAPNVIILDRMMPGVDGLTIFHRLRAGPKTKEIPILFLTAKGKQEDVLEALNEGAQDYVVKPFNVEDVVTRCARYMRVKIRKGM